jgi:hypothetical protein
MPWLVAGFLAVLFLVPVHAVALNVPAPIDPTLDRFLVAGILAAWCLGRVLGVLRAPHDQPMAFKVALGVLLAVAILSVLLDVQRIARVGELPLAIKQLAQLGVFVALGAVVATSLRPAELRAFAWLLVGLATLTALSVIYEKRTGFNAPYVWSGSLFSSFATVLPSPTDIHPDPLKTPRPNIVGPTDHGLAATTMLSMVLPFAVLLALDAATRRRRVLAAVAAVLMLAAALSTARKTAVLAPIGAVAVLVAYRPRRLVRVAPYALAGLLSIAIIAPGALSTVRQFNAGFFDTATTQGRTTDYAAIAPDVLAHPILGRGYGTVDIAQADTYRILDNQYLGTLWMTGALGILAYLGVIAAAMALAHRPARGGRADRALPALAASAACASFFVASALYDLVSFVQAPYMLMVVGGIATVAATGLRREEAAR